jgi:hypothetical protein
MLSKTKEEKDLRFILLKKMKHYNNLYLVGSFHHGMSYLQVADGGGGLQIWRVAMSKLNKHSRGLPKRRSSTA